MEVETTEFTLLNGDALPFRGGIRHAMSVPDYFPGNDGEVIAYEAVAIVAPEIVLAEEGQLTFEAKMITPKLTMHPVPYKINNPSRIQKVGP